TAQVRLAEGDVEQNRGRAAWADRMVKRKYMSPAQAQAERSRLDSSVEKLRSLTTQRSLLKDQTRRRDLVDLAGKLETARRTLEQAKQELVAKTAQADSAYRTAAAVYAQEYAKLQDFQSQIKECRIHAPQD